MRSTEKKDRFAEELKLTAPELKKLGIIDAVIREPLGGAQNNPEQVAGQLKDLLLQMLDELSGIPADTLVEERIRRFRNIGRWTE
jgi:acetyl-CoA carboxylase carboxyl transferase subunit alpha